MSQSPICPVCSSYMGLVKDNTHHKCPTCGYMEKIVKKEIKSMYSSGPGISDVDDFNAY